MSNRRRGVPERNKTEAGRVAGRAEGSRLRGQLGREQWRTEGEGRDGEGVRGELYLGREGWAWIRGPSL